MRHLEDCIGHPKDVNRSAQAAYGGTLNRCNVYVRWPSPTKIKVPVLQTKKGSRKRGRGCTEPWVKAYRKEGGV